MGKLRGPFKDIIPIFQDAKKALGYKYDNISLFNELDKYLFNKNIKDLSDTKFIFDVAINQENNISKKKDRYYCLKQLYEFMEDALNYNNLYFENISFKDDSSFIPVILTNKQIKLFFKKVDNLSSPLDNKEANIYPILFRLLYSSGLRISEALNLKNVDISMVQGTITIVKSKGDITRILPLSSSMKNVLKKYLSTVNTETYLFEIDNKPISYNKVSDFFHDVIKDDFKFRIHDLRHTFAVTVCNKLYNDGYSFDQILYFLHIYMGHTTIESTEYYLRMTNESYKKILDKSHKKYPNIIPKVGDKK